MQKKILILMIIFVFIFSTFVNAANIKDVPADHWAYQSVKELVDKGLLQLYEDGTFRGTDGVSRYQLSVIVARILEEIDSGNVNASPQDMELLRELSVEFRDELVDLAGQGESFNKRIKEIEQKNLIQDEFMTEIKDVDISTLQTEIDNLTDRITNVESDVTQIIDSILKIKQIEERIAAIENTNDKQNSLIQGNQNQINDLKNASLQINDETITSLQNRISINDTRINSLQEEINRLKSQLDSKDNRIDELKLEKDNNQNYLYIVGGVALLLLLSN